MNHEHSMPSHSHAHETANTHHRFSLGIVLNAGLALMELFYGFQSESVALVSDAIHNAGDVLTLGLAWLAIVLAKRKRSARFTYGFKNVTILASFVNSALLMLAVGAIAWEAFLRFQYPAATASYTVMWVAFFAILVNGSTAFLFLKGSQRDINLKSIYVNMASDVALSFGVLLSAGLTQLTSWLWLDPAASLIVCVFIVLSNWEVFKESSTLILQAAPASIDTHAVLTCLSQIENVDSVHDLHIWAIGSSEVALSAHVVMKNGDLARETLKTIKNELNGRFEIGHSTIQLERQGEGEADNCDMRHS